MGKRFNSDPWFSWLQRSIWADCGWLERSLGEGLNACLMANRCVLRRSEKYVEGTLTDGSAFERHRLGERVRQQLGGGIGAGAEVRSGAHVVICLFAELRRNDRVHPSSSSERRQNIIIIDEEPQFFFQPLNLGRTRIGGYELGLTGKARWDPFGQDSRGVYLQLRRRFDQ